MKPSVLKIVGIPLLLICSAIWMPLAAQHLSIHIQPVFYGEKIVLEHPFIDPAGNSLNISLLKCYLGNFAFWKNGKIVFSEKSYHLIDLEDEHSLQLSFNFSGKTAFDSLRFDLGVDSLTTMAGAMGGDLDPTKGMFWTWQSGYVNFKTEGVSSQSSARNGGFEFHLGGFLPPFQTARHIKVGAIPNPDEARLDFDLTPFFQKIEWQKNPNIMSPGAEAVRLMDILATSFSWHEK